MKISKLQIDKFRHLENLFFDFTYPPDFHDKTKRGKPLDKICIIGQSATGKTGLLELIYSDIRALKSVELAVDELQFEANEKFLSNIEIQVDSKIVQVNAVNHDGKHNGFELLLNGTRVKGNLNTFENKKHLIEKGIKNKLFFLKSDLLSLKNIEVFNSNPQELKENMDLDSWSKSIAGLDEVESVEFGEEIERILWLSLLNEIIIFHSKRYKKYAELIGKGLVSDLAKFNTLIKKFLDENPNPLEELGERFNGIFEKLGLQVDDNNTEFAIPIKNTRNNEVIPIQSTSTGTKQLLLTSFPLYQLETQGAIILIDEPERSLYPDVQMELMEHYKNLAPEAQFIVATHSPFIAASFEPEERFILYFDEIGNVLLRRGVSPIGDDPNDLLYNDFGVDYINKYGKAKYQEYLELKNRMRVESDEKRKKDISQRIESIGEQYNF